MILRRFIVVVAVFNLYGQLGRREAEWMTAGADAQRSHWIPADARISRQSLAKPGFQFLWKVKLATQPAGLTPSMPPVLIDRYIGYRGFRSLAFLAGASDRIFGIDTDLARVEWQQQVPSGAGGCLSVPGIARETSAAYPPSEAVGGGLGGRASPARSDVSPPGQGAVTVPAAMARISALANAPAPQRAFRPRLPAVIHLVTGDGKLHSLYISNGMESGTPLDFVPPNTGTQGLIVLARVAYAATGNCGGAPSGIWSLDLDSKEASHWQPAAGAIAGSAGPAFGPDDTLYAATSAGQLVSLAARGLNILNTYATGGAAFTSSPVVFPYKGRTLVAAASSDKKIHLIDTASFSGTANPVYGGQGFAPTALAAWQDLDGVRWILAADGSPRGAIAAWRVIDRNDAMTVEPGWRSAEMLNPQTPAIISGVVFALSGGNQSSPAVLYALDGLTGRKLWESGQSITSFVQTGGVSGEAGQVYLETYDGTLYAFGYPMEH
ncbi:MAG TPA: hypothetical protein VKX49_26375 [Bryobacteraceae bacterium]|nr:hypothetical protein [Bryobacteraceae bacterium]